MKNHITLSFGQQKISPRMIFDILSQQKGDHGQPPPGPFKCRRTQSQLEAHSPSGMAERNLELRWVDVLRRPFGVLDFFCVFGFVFKVCLAGFFNYRWTSCFCCSNKIKWLWVEAPIPRCEPFNKHHRGWLHIFIPKKNRRPATQLTPQTAKWSLFQHAWIYWVPFLSSLQRHFILWANSKLAFVSRPKERKTSGA